MQKRKNIMCCVLAAALVLPTMLWSVPALADGEDAGDGAAAETSTETSVTADDEAEAWVDRTEADVFEKLKKVAENDNLEFWAPDESKVSESDDEKVEDMFALVNKKNGYVWWSSPINAGGDSIASKVLRSEIGSSMVLTAAQIEDRSTSNMRSGDTAKVGLTFTETDGGVKVEYYFRKMGIKIPVTYKLGTDFLEVSVDTAKISEKHDASSEEPILAQQLAFLNSFGAADMTEEGYFVIPDGSGALINFNNEKYTAKAYSQLIYDVDVTAVPKTKGPVVEGVSLPMYGIVKGENAMLAVAAEGDGSCYICSDVSGTGQSNTEYNRCYFKFLLRSSDQYYLGSDQLNPLDVYEKNLSERKLTVRYYPLTASDEINADGSAALDYVDIAAKYREYLLNEQKVPQKAKANSAEMYVDLYGGTMKQKNVLGFPIFMKTSMTSYSEMQEILTQLKDAGADSMTVSLNNWTNAGISGKVDYKGKASGTLGGSGDFKKLTGYMNDNSIAWYPTVDNSAYYTGQGYWSLTDTAVRVSGSFARIVDYERAYGVPYGEKKTMSLLSPATFPELYEKLVKNYQKQALPGVSIGSMSAKLYGDYGKKSGTARDTTKQYIVDSLGKMQDAGLSVLSEDPNAYVLPYTDRITDLPLYSSGFNIFDADVPLYQLVMHGVLPYSTKAVNGSADAERLVMLALAAGSNLHFDMLYAETNELKDTDFDVYYYAYYEYWIKNAAQYYQFSKDVLAAASDSYIISYVNDGDVITTKYANGAETVVDLNECSVSLNGQKKYLKDYVEEGAVVFE
ncbi:MAG: hypothetical protein IKS42_03065 [Oscillospiraceae bacterium]|nr:hypothetical protein [Oscillospiraceae bacterium]